MSRILGPRLLCVSLLLLLLPTLPKPALPLFAQSPGAGSSDEVVADLLDAMSLKAAVKEYARAMEVQMAGRDDPASRAAAQAVRFEVLLDALVRRLKPNLNPAHAAIAAKWFRTPIGRKVAEASLESAAPEAAQRAQSYAVQMQSTPPTDRRLALIDRVIGAGETANMQAEISIAMVRGSTLALAPYLPPEKRPRPADMEQMASRIRAQFQSGEAQTQIQNLTLFVYRKLTVMEIEEMLRFAESEAGRSVTKAFNGALAGASEEIVRQASTAAFKVKPPNR